MAGDKLTSTSQPNRHELTDVYPYPVIPKSTRPTLERSFQIDNINQVNPDDTLEMARRIKLADINRQQEIVRTFCRDELNEAGYAAAALGSVMDLYSGINNQYLVDRAKDGSAELKISPRQHSSIRAGQALAEFFRNNTPNNYYSTENIYIAGLLQDRYRLSEFKTRTETGEIDDDYNTPPGRDEWLADPAITDSKTLLEAVSNINIESFLISGAETLRQLSSHATNDRATLDAIRYSEQIVSPIAEVIGFDSLALSLSDLTKTLRLLNGGRADLIIKANAIHDRYRSIDRSQTIAENVRLAVDNIIHQLFGRLDNFQLRQPIDFNDNNQSVYGDTEVSVFPTSNGEVNASLRYRLKTAGSLGWKMLQEEKAGRSTDLMPLDILGITLVTKSEADQIKLFNTIVSNLYSNDNLTPYAESTKTSATHVRGTGDYINRMSADLPVDVDTKIAEASDELHLGKVTGFYGNLPFEIQCVTREYRNAMQTGQLAHIIYKSSSNGKISHEDLQDWSKLLTSIRERRHRISKPTLLDVYEADTPDYVSASNNTNQAHRLIVELLELDSIVDRTVGTFAVAASS